MDEKISRMQLQVDKHESQIGKLFSRIENTNLCIQKINTSLLQIKWGVFGAFAWYLIGQIGIIEAISLL